MYLLVFTLARRYLLVAEQKTPAWYPVNDVSSSPYLYIILFLYLQHVWRSDVRERLGRGHYGQLEAEHQRGERLQQLVK